MNHNETADVEALAEAIDYKSLPYSTIPEPEHALDIARAILASDWLAAYVAASERRALAAERVKVATVLDALDRTEDRFKLAVLGKPVRDMAETLAENAAARATALRDASPA